MLALGWAAGAWAQNQAGGEPRDAGQPSVADQNIVLLLRSLDRPVHVEFANVSPQEAFALLAQAGGIPIVVDPAVPRDLRVRASFRNVPLGDALSMVSLHLGLQLVPGARSVVVTPAPVVSVTAPEREPPRPVVTGTSPWVGWAETLKLPLMPGGQTGYPRIVRLAGPGLPDGVTVVGPADAKCARCGAAMLWFWAFCPHCGHQRLARGEGKFCWGCGRPLEGATSVVVPAPGTLRPQR